MHRGGRRGRHGRENLVYALGGFRPPTPAKITTLYRRGFAIESSYRQLNQARPRTCTRDPRVRLFLVGVAMVLRNLWIYWQDRLPPCRTMPLAELRFKHYLLMVFRSVQLALDALAEKPDVDDPATTDQ